MDTVLWLFGTAGLTWMITRHEWMKFIREWASEQGGLLDDLFNCYYCSGAWCGAATYYMLEWWITTGVVIFFAGAAISLIFIEVVLKLNR